MPISDIAKRRKINCENMRKWRAKKSSIEIPPPEFARERKKAEKDLLYFMRFFFPEFFGLPFSETHVEVVRDIQSTIENGGNLARCLPRGTGKSTMLMVAVLWMIATGKRKFAVVCRATIADAKQVVADMVDILSNSDGKFAKAYPEITAPFAALEGSPRRAQSQLHNGKRTKLAAGIDRIVFPTIEGSASSGSIVLAKSSQSNLRGLNKGGVRPDFILLDDVENSDMVFSDSSQRRIERFCLSEVPGLAGPGKSISSFFLGTIQRRGCIADRLTDLRQFPAYRGKRYSALIQAPDKPDLWVEYQEKRKNSPDEANSFYAQNKAEMDAGSKVLWEHRFDPSKETSALQAIFNYRTDYGETSFLTELQNTPPEEMEILDDHLSTKDITKRIISIEKGVVPNGFQKIIVGVDVGKHLIHYVITAFDRHNSGHVVDYGVRDVAILGNDSGFSIKKALIIFQDEVVNPGFKDEGGNSKNIDLVLIDSGYMPEPIYAFCRENGFRKFRPCKGHSRYGAEKGGVKLSRYFVPKDINKSIAVGNNFYFNRIAPGTLLSHINVDFFKENLIDRWKNDNQHGGMSIYSGVWTDHIRFASHMTAEQLRDDFKPGRAITRKWIKHSRANHYLDALVLCLAGASMLGGPASFEDDGQDVEKTPQNTPSESESGRVQRQSGNAKIGKCRINFVKKNFPGYQPLPY